LAALDGAENLDPADHPPPKPLRSEEKVTAENRIEAADSNGASEPAMPEQRRPSGSRELQDRLADQEDVPVAVAQKESADRPPISDERMEHVLYGGINGGGKGTGWHHSADGNFPDGRRYSENAVRTNLSDPADPSSNGVYHVKFLEFQKNENTWVTKTGSTFYPDTWSGDQVRQTVTAAWEDQEGARDEADETWTGTDSSNGFRVTGYYDSSTGEMKTAWPDYQLK
jgi:hypothetical protein